MKNEIKELLTKLEFIADEKQPLLYAKKIDENTIAYVDFRKAEFKEKGRRFIKKGDNFDIEPDTIPELKMFKEERDKILGVERDLSVVDGKDNRTGSGQANGKEKSELNVGSSPAHPTLQSSGAASSDLSGVGNPDKTNKIAHSKDSPGTSKSSSTEVERQNNNGTHDAEPENSPIHTVPHTQDLKGVSAPTTNLYEFFYELVGAGGIIEIFGDTGSLKSQLCTETCKDARKINKSVFYLDTEGKVGLKNKKDLGSDYKYVPIWDDIVKDVNKLPRKDVVIIDSIGFPISAKSAGMKLNEQGQAWNDMMSLVGDVLKAWAYKNNAIAIITNQPKSEFMKSDEELQRLSAVGDKVHFAPNLILRSRKTIIPAHYDKDTKKTSPPISVGTYTSFRSPDFMDDVDVLILYKNDNEIRIKVPEHISKRIQELKS